MSLYGVTDRYGESVRYGETVRYGESVRYGDSVRYGEKSRCGEYVVLTVSEYIGSYAPARTCLMLSNACEYFR